MTKLTVAFRNFANGPKETEFRGGGNMHLPYDRKKSGNIIFQENWTLILAITRHRQVQYVLKAYGL